jgi:hypothetical protein
MHESCDHTFEDAAAVFTGTVRTRACARCNRVEVMIATTGQWVHIEEYMDRRIANRTDGDLRKLSD